MTDDEPTWPGVHYADTVPKIRVPPPPPPWWVRWWRSFRENLGLVGVLLVVGCVLAGIALTTAFVPAVRHGVGKIVKHQDTIKTTVPGRSASPPVRRSYPVYVPVSSSTPRSSRSAKPAASPSRSRITSKSASATPRQTTARPSPKPTPAPTTSSPSPAPTTSSPAPTPSTPTASATASATTSAATTVSTTPSTCRSARRTGPVPCAVLSVEGPAGRRTP